MIINTVYEIYLHREKFNELSEVEVDKGEFKISNNFEKRGA